MVEDIEVMGEQMGASLTRRFSQRGPNDEPWTVSIDKVTNLTDDLLTQGEQWGIMARLRGTQPIVTLWDEKKVRFVITPERRDLVKTQQPLDFDERFGQERAVTHVLTATFRSVQRGDFTTRTDLYACEFELIDVRAGQPVWNDRYEFKRQALGAVWD